MRATSLVFSLLAFVASLQCAAQAPPVPPVLEYLFTATVNVGKPLSQSGTKTVAGGIEIVEPIVGGSITGPVFNGTIYGGVAYPSIYKNQTIQIASLLIYGNTTDGHSLLVRGDGIGIPSDQIARLTLDIDGPYSCVASSFIVAELLPNQDRTVVHVDAYKVPLSTKS